MHPDIHRFPADGIFCKGKYFGDIFNPKNMSFRYYILSFLPPEQGGTITSYYHNDRIESQGEFSDEALMEHILLRWTTLNKEKKLIPVKGYNDLLIRRSDRAYNCPVDMDKLRSGWYLEVQPVRPFTPQAYDILRPLLDALNLKENLFLKR
jgi:hypothetical protein